MNREAKASAERRTFMQIGHSILRLLGRFGLQVDGTPTTPIRISSKKGCALIAYLAMHGAQCESREALATLLWGNHPDRQARQNLRQCLASLRADVAMTCPDLLVFENDTIRLNLAKIDVDAIQFAKLAESSAAEDLIRASAIYRGEFLAGFSFDVEPFDEWMRAERGRIAVTAAKVFEACVTHFDRLGDGAGTIEAAERLVLLDPLREEWQRLLLRAYARFRGADAALAHAHALTTLLKRELSVDPDSATNALLTEIRRGSIGRAAVAADPVVASTKLAKEAVAMKASEPTAIARRRWFRNPLGSIAFAGSGTRRTLLTIAAIAVLGGGLFFLSRALIAPSQTVNAWTPPQPPPGLAGNMAALRAQAIIPIVIWPFSAPEAGDRKLADTITDDLITNMSRSNGLRVISRQTSRYYGGHATDAAAAGAELGVSFVVEGSVRTRDTQVLINIQLVDTATRLQVWADQFERDNFERFDVQNEIAKRLARELRVEAIVSKVHYDQKQTEPPIAALIAQGHAAQFRGADKIDISEALGYFEQALQRDPHLVPALVGVATALTMGSLNYTLDPEPSLKRADKLMQQALQISPDSASANYWMGMVSKALGHFDAAFRLFQRAIEIEPSFAAAYAQAGITLTLMDHANDAMHYIQYAMRLSPKDRTMRFWTMFAGVTEFELGNDKAAREWFSKSAAYFPHPPSFHLLLAGIDALTGDKEAAAMHAAEFRNQANSAAAAEVMEQVKLGDRGEYANLRRLRSGLELAFKDSL